MHRTATLLLAAFGTATWGTTYAVTTELLPPGHPYVAALVRALPAGLVAIALSRSLPRGRWWGRAFALGALNIGLFFPLLFVAAERLPGGVAAAAAGLGPLVAILLGGPVLHERIRPSSLAIAIAGAVGVALVALGPAAGLDPIGLAAAVGGTTVMALGTVLTKKWGRPAGVGALGFAGWQLTTGGIVLVPLTLAFDEMPSAIGARGVVGYAWLALVGGLVAYTLWFRGVQRLPIAASGLLPALSPLVAAAIGVGILGETFTPAQAAGFALAMAAVIGGQVWATRPARGARAAGAAPRDARTAEAAPVA
ncbi:EamA family transporter [Microbacterium excoecariae]|uniref:EamA family transporter n=1 Tax=Microbacterium excoecariae TaxID=2715210 RepID=UPI0014088CDE|nr:EamA family transporter [Microbacterium excoecariae]NHI16015.1 EamA family transporter [Microbacterium excoecariae]